MQYCTVYLPCQACNITNKNHIADYQTKFDYQNISSWPSWIKQNKQKRHEKRHINSWKKISIPGSVYSEYEKFCSSGLYVYV